MLVKLALVKSNTQDRKNSWERSLEEQKKNKTRKKSLKETKGKLQRKSPAKLKYSTYPVNSPMPSLHSHLSDTAPLRPLRNNNQSKKKCQKDKNRRENMKETKSLFYF